MDINFYLVSSNSRGANQDKIDDSFFKIRDFLNTNGLMINEVKTHLTEYMTKQGQGQEVSPQNSL